MTVDACLAIRPNGTIGSRYRSNGVYLYAKRTRNSISPAARLAIGYLIFVGLNARGIALSFGVTVIVTRPNAEMAYHRASRQAIELNAAPAS